jgi:radical SAM superfamily enzyme YgiQ (UPF0313 family)
MEHWRIEHPLSMLKYSILNSQFSILNPMTWNLTEKLRAVVAREEGVIRKEWGGKTSVALLFPNTYRIGMGNLAVHALYERLNREARIVCERAFLPEPRELALHRASGTPVLSLESQRPLADFDVVALTVSFENDYLHLPLILELSRIPLRAEARAVEMPTLLAGGAAPTLNPLPLALIADAVILGEIEAFAGDLLPLLAAGLSKPELCEGLAKLRGALVGSPDTTADGRLERRHAVELDTFATQTVIHAHDVEFGALHLIEVERGCRHRCRFCATPAIYGPARRRSAAAVLAMVEAGWAHRHRMGLIGADILSHPEFQEIVQAIHARGGTFSPSSVRADAVDERRASLLAASGHRAVALGVEAGSDRLRATLGKGLSEERILEAVAALARAGIGNVRLYFMIGLPGETEEDVAAIAALARRAREILRAAAPRRTRATGVGLTVAPFVPKPHTPFAGAPFAGRALLKQRIACLRRLLRKERGIALRCDSVVDAQIEAMLANADAHAVSFLEEAHRRGSAREAIDAQGDAMLGSAIP